MDDQNPDKEPLVSSIINLYLPMVLAGLLLFVLIFNNGGCVPR